MTASDTSPSLEEMRAAGATVEDWPEAGSVLATTDDPELAKQFEMYDESELHRPA
jgi:hypothetical protein